MIDLIAKVAFCVGLMSFVCYVVGKTILVLYISYMNEKEMMKQKREEAEWAKEMAEKHGVPTDQVVCNLSTQDLPPVTNMASGFDIPEIWVKENKK